jgi:hypothetical protein
MPINGPDAQILEIVDRQVYLAQEVINRYWYRLDSTSTPDLTALEVSFENTVLNGVSAVQVAQLTHVDVTIINHSNPESFGTFTSDIDGELVTTDLLPPFCAVGVRLNRASREIRNGQKRIAGLGENSQIDGIFTSSFITLLVAELGVLNSTLTESIRNYFPVVVRNKPTEADPGIDPQDASTWRYSTFTGVTIKNAVTTQNSRKF